MAYLIEIPVEAGGRLFVEASAEDVDGLGHASRAGEALARAGRSLESTIDEIRPALGVVLARLHDLAASEVEVAFGLKLGAETGVVVAKGSSEVHLDVRLVWHRDPEEHAAGA